MIIGNKPLRLLQVGGATREKDGSSLDDNAPYPQQQQEHKDDGQDYHQHNKICMEMFENDL